MNNYDRYNRQIHKDMLLDEHQALLKKSVVTICGCGGLGTPAATYLAMAGIGTIHLFDKDTIEITNLNRQFHYTTGDIGKPKASVLSEQLCRLNPEIYIKSYVVDITTDNSFMEALSISDIVIDCLDTITARKILSNKAKIYAKPIIHGGVRAWFGQIAIFNPNEQPELSALPEQIPERPFIPSIGVIPGIIGTMQALECIKMLLGFPLIDSKKIYTFNGFSFGWSSYEKQIFIPKNKNQQNP